MRLRSIWRSWLVICTKDFINFVIPTVSQWWKFMEIMKKRERYMATIMRGPSRTSRLISMETFRVLLLLVMCVWNWKRGEDNVVTPEGTIVNFVDIEQKAATYNIHVCFIEERRRSRCVRAGIAILEQRSSRWIWRKKKYVLEETERSLLGDWSDPRVLLQGFEELPTPGCDYGHSWSVGWWHSTVAGLFDDTWRLWCGHSLFQVELSALTSKRWHRGCDWMKIRFFLFL